MFDKLGSKLETIFSRLRGHGKITSADIEEGLREIKIAFLEADVNFRVVKDFVARVKEQALGEKVMKSLTPGQQIIKIVRDEMISVLGDDAEDIRFDGKELGIIMLVGLQGGGKTTTAAKLALRLKNQGANPLLVSVDVYRPAARKQLKDIAERYELSCSEAEGKNPVEIAKNALSQAKKEPNNVLIIDTAGRLHVDDEMMNEAKELSAKIHPQEVIYVADSMTGQDAVNSALVFAGVVPLTGVVLTKLDGDARGGAAFSIKSVTGVPIRYVGVGEKAENLELFHPDRLVSRILGMGDVLSLIEKAEETVDREEAEALAEKMLKNEFTLNDFASQLKQIKKMGPISQIMSMIPGMSKVPGIKQVDMDDAALRRIEGIINSMTPQERLNHTILNGSRRKRIAKGSGTTVQQVNQLIKQFVQMKKMMKKIGKFGLKGKHDTMDFSSLMRMN